MPDQIWALLASFVICLVTGPIIIPALRRLKFGQVVRDEGPASHHKKTGTPTMGGLIFILAVTVVSIVYAVRFPEILPLLLVTLAFGAIGFIDDFIKVVLKRNLGLRAKQKMLGLIVVSAAFAAYIQFYTTLGTSILIPFTGRYFNLAWAFIPFTIFVLISITNAVNLTDGLDGLASGVTLVVMVFYALYAMTSGTNDEHVLLFSAIMAGGCLGFLVFNSHPARVFMGDTGSLALGGAVGAIAVTMNNPIIIIIVGGVYVMEALSVVIQVVSFKTTGKRVFKMAPLHHHFELSGWKETTVVLVFWGVTVLLCVIGFFSIRL